MVVTVTPRFPSPINLAPERDVDSGSGAPVQINASTAANAIAMISAWLNAANGPILQFKKSRGAAIGTHGAVALSDVLGSLTFQGSDGTQFRTACTLQVLALAAAPGSTDMQGRFIVSPTPSGAVAQVQLAWFDHTNGLSIGTSIPVQQISAAGYFVGPKKITAQASSPVTLNTTTDKRAVHTNEGATGMITINLPTAAAGYEYEFCVQDADGIRIVAATGDTIRINGNVSGAAGHADSTTIGSTLRLVSINATEWVACGSSGTWSVT